MLSIRFRNGTCIIILDKKYNIANSSCHFGSYGSIWTGPSTKKLYVPESNRKRGSPVPVHITLYWPAALKKTNRENKNVKYNISIYFYRFYSIWTGPSTKKLYMGLRSFCPYNIFLVTDWSIYCHMTLSAMNYLLYYTRLPHYIMWC
jgi:hypothetical protein